ncbi:MAG: trigger factor [Planctomycetota bacterium]
MDVTVAESGPCRRTLTISIPPESVRTRLDQAFKDASTKVKLKGFRSGRVPRAVLEKRYGEAIRAEAREQLMNESLRTACEEKGLEMVGRPELDGAGSEESNDEAEQPTAPELDESKPFEFTVHFDVRPEFELMDVSTIEVEAEPTKVTDEDVEQGLAQLADQKKTLEKVDEPIQEGDFLTAKLDFQDEGGDSILVREDAKLNLNLPIAGADTTQFQAALNEKKAGDTADVGLTFPDNFEVEDVRGQTGTVKVHIEEVQRVVAAPIDDELAKSFEFESVDELRKTMGERIGIEKIRAEKARQEGAILQRLADEHPFEIPESTLEQQKEGERNKARQQMQQAGADEESIEARIAEASDDIDKQAERMVRLFYIVDAIARKEGLRVEREELEQEVHAIAAHHGVDVQEVVKAYQERNMFGELQLGILERKARAWLRQTAKISGQDFDEDADLTAAGESDGSDEGASGWEASSAEEKD